MREVRQAFRRFWPLTRGDRGWLVAIIGCVVVSALAETASILLFAQLTDNALEAGSLSAFWGPAGAWLGVAANSKAAMATAGTAVAISKRFNIIAPPLLSLGWKDTSFRPRSGATGSSTKELASRYPKAKSANAVPTGPARRRVGELAKFCPAFGTT